MFKKPWAFVLSRADCTAAAPEGSAFIRSNQAPFIGLSVGSSSLFPLHGARAHFFFQAKSPETGFTVPDCVVLAAAARAAAIFALVAGTVRDHQHPAFAAGRSAFVSVARRRIEDGRFRHGRAGTLGV